MDLLRMLGAMALASLCGMGAKAQTSIGDSQDLIEIEGPIVYMRQPALQVIGLGGRIAQPCGIDAIAVDRWGNLYAVDSVLNTIEVWSYYTLNGEPLETISSDTFESAGLGPLKRVRAIFAGARNGLQSTGLYLLDQGGDKNTVPRILTRPYLFSTQWVQLPFDDFRQTPLDLTIDVSGRLIISEGNGVVEVLLPDGSGRDARFGNEGVLELDEVDGSDTSSLVAVDTDAQGNIYVADSENRRIIKADPSGNVMRVFGSRGDGRHQFRGPVAGVALDWRGNVYGLDEWQKSYPVFAPNGRFITRLGEHAFELHPQPRAGDFVIDKISHRFIVIDEETRRLSIHTMTRGQFLSRNFSRHDMAKLLAPHPVIGNAEQSPNHGPKETASENISSFQNL